MPAFYGAPLLPILLICLSTFERSEGLPSTDGSSRVAKIVRNRRQDVCSRMDIIKLDGQPGASQAWRNHVAANAFKPERHVPWAAESRLPATVWFKFLSNVHLNRISFTSRRGKYWFQAPETFDIVASNNGKNWQKLLHVESAGFSKGGQTKTWDVACNNDFFKYVGVKVLKANSGANTALTNITMWGQTREAISLAHGGKASASTLWHISNASSAFQGGQWHSQKGVPQWIQYELNQPKSVCQISFKPRQGMPSSQSDCPYKYEFRGSLDGSNFETLLVVDNQNCQNDVEIQRNIDNCRPFKFYRLVILDSVARSNNNKFAIIKDLKFFGEDQVSTPVTAVLGAPPMLGLNETKGGNRPRPIVTQRTVTQRIVTYPTYPTKGQVKQVTKNPCIGKEYSADPKNCNVFFQCSGGKMVKLPCPPGLHWNQQEKMCDWPHKVNRPECPASDLSTIPTTSTMSTKITILLSTASTMSTTSTPRSPKTRSLPSTTTTTKTTTTPLTATTTTPLTATTTTPPPPPTATKTTTSPTATKTTDKSKTTTTTTSSLIQQTTSSVLTASASVTSRGCFNDWKAGNHRDNNPKTCQRYIEEKWCTEEGTLGPRWKDVWGTFANYADADGNDARVCPQCGCGKVEPAIIIGDWLFSVGGRELKINETRKSWAEARRACQSEGGDLVTVDSPAIDRFLSAKKGPLWIGASKSGDEFVWTNGQPVRKPHWAPNEPNNTKGEDCVEVNNPDKHYGTWSVRQCSVEHGFVCEKEELGSSTHLNTSAINRTLELLSTCNKEKMVSVLGDFLQQLQHIVEARQRRVNFLKALDEVVVDRSMLAVDPLGEIADTSKFESDQVSTTGAQLVERTTNCESLNEDAKALVKKVEDQTLLAEKLRDQIRDMSKRLLFGSHRLLSMIEYKSLTG